ncbi:MAG: amidohydrolase [Clostridia bacterium]|nr:amidohydrolase [Clostridia bacterium]
MYRIFDIHTHTYPEAISDRAVVNLGNFYNFLPEGKGTYAELSSLAPENGVEGFLLFSVATNAHQVEKVNSFIAALAARSVSEGFKTVGFAGMHQDYPDFEKELSRAWDLGLRGVKIHPDIQGVDIDDPKLLPLYRLMEGKMPLYLHMGDDRPQYRFSEAKKLARILDMFPDLEVVAAHLSGYNSWEDGIKYLAGNPRVWYDTSSAVWAMTPEYAGDVIHRLGTDRVMFGTDYPVMLPHHEIDRILAIDLTEKEREDIFYNNAVRFLHLEDK